MNWFRNTSLVWLQEIKDVLHDQGIMIFIMFVPLFYPVLYSVIYTNELVKEVPLAVVDASNSGISREFVRKMDATAEVCVAAKCESLESAKELLNQRDVYGVMYVPDSFSKDIAHGEQTTIGLYCDMGSMLYYKCILLSANNVALEMNRSIKVERYLQSTSDKQDEIEKMPIDYRYVSLYNSQSGFAAFLIPPVLMLIIQQTLCLGVGMSMGRRRENYRKNVKLLQGLYTDASSVVVGKGMFYFVLYLVLGSYMFSVVTPCFSLPTIGNYFTFFSFLIPYVLACTFFAILVSSLVFRREDCIMLFVSISVPLLFLSGITWPSESMPDFWRYVSYLFPSTFGIRGYVRIANMGVSLNDVEIEYVALWVQSLFYFIASCLVYRWRMNLVWKKLGMSKTSFRVHLLKWR